MTHRVLIIAGSDSSGGAGVVRDLAVASDFSVQPVLAVTAVTAQGPQGVSDIHLVSPETVAAQIRCALEAGVDAIKIGMLGGAANIDAVRAEIGGRAIPTVLDPVLASSTGSNLLPVRDLHHLRKTLFPLCDLLTPNLPEAARLLDRSEATSAASIKSQGLALLEMGPKAVLMKGGHGSGGMSTDILIQESGFQSFSSPRLAVTARGTGCSLSTAIACAMATGQSVPRACETAKAYVADCLSGLASVTPK